MARIYIRLKHFVAAYVRTTYGDGTDNPAQELVLNRYSRASEILEHMQCNVNDKVVDNCFCERQWQRMMRGESIARNADNFMVTPRDAGEWLNEDEVCELAGIDHMRGEDIGVFVCIKAPDDVKKKNGDTAHVNGQWQLMSDWTANLIDMLEDEFDVELYHFVKEAQGEADGRGYKRYVNDALECFMTKYNIRNCADDREKRCMKRRFYRYKRDKMQDNDDERSDDFFTGKEVDHRSSYTNNRCKKVQCLNDSKVYDSMHQAATTYQLSYQALWNAIRRGSKCGGMKFVLL